jgi:hypothetical protein
MNSHGVDLDCTLATYEEFVAPDVIGEPIPLMVERVRQWLENGDRVDVFTARAHPSHGPEQVEKETRVIKKWFYDVFGVEPIVTCQKDPQWEDIWDDKTVQVIPNTGMRADGIEDVEIDRSDGIGGFLV